VRGLAHAGPAALGDELESRRHAAQHQRQRPGPVAARQAAQHGARELEALQRRRGAHVPGQRLARVASLELRQARQRLRVVGARGESVDGLGRQTDHGSAAQRFAREGGRVGCERGIAAGEDRRGAGHRGRLERVLRRW
jgi:hypothetical protein